MTDKHVIRAFHALMHELRRQLGTMQRFETSPILTIVEDLALSVAEDARRSVTQQQLKEARANAASIVSALVNEQRAWESQCDLVEAASNSVKEEAVWERQKIRELTDDDWSLANLMAKAIEAESHPPEVSGTNLGVIVLEGLDPNDPRTPDRATNRILGIIVARDDLLEEIQARRDLHECLLRVAGCPREIWVQAAYDLNALGVTTEGKQRRYGTYVGLTPLGRELARLAQEAKAP